MRDGSRAIGLLEAVDEFVVWRRLPVISMFAPRLSRI
jgi:hypothetical protein